MNDDRIAVLREDAASAGAARARNRFALWGIALLLLFPSSAVGQFVALKTVPVASGDQFLLFPSRNLGMGGVGIALNDSVQDPFVNPAKGARVQSSHVFAAPVYYNVSNRAGSGGSLPLGALFSGRWFGGGRRRVLWTFASVGERYTCECARFADGNQ